MTKRRVLVAVLWIYSCYAAGGFAEYLIGTPALIGLTVGIAAAVFFGLDPLGVVWPKTGDKAVRAEPAPSVETGAPAGSPVWQ